jgi:hypothetical protein
VKSSSSSKRNAESRVQVRNYLAALPAETRKHVQQRRLFAGPPEIGIDSGSLASSDEPAGIAGHSALSGLDRVPQPAAARGPEHVRLSRLKLTAPARRLGRVVRHEEVGDGYGRHPEAV